MNSYETYILKKIKQLEDDLNLLVSEKDATYSFGGKNIKVYPENQYWINFHRLSGQIGILYMVLTGHDNKYDEDKTTKK